MTSKVRRTLSFIVFATCASVSLIATALAQQAPKVKAGKNKNAQQSVIAKAKAEANAAQAKLAIQAESQDEKVHRDFPDISLDAKGQPWVCYIENDGKADALHLAKVNGDK
ncbi:MAG: hypothetical protein WCN98_01595, partial [Verrucomicrobiaceae bacterium]